MYESQPESMERRGYPWWGWLLGIWFLIPLAFMFIGMSSPRARRRLSGWAVAGYSGLIYIAFIILIVVAAIVDDSGTDATQAASPKPTATPTAIPTPVPTLAPCQRADVQAYFDEMLEITGPLEQIYLKIGALTAQAGSNPLLVFDEDWRFEVVVHLAGMKVAAEQIRELNAPPHVRHIHSDLLEMATGLDRAADLFAAGMDNFDPDLLALSAEQIDANTELVIVAAAKVNALCQ